MLKHQMGLSCSKTSEALKELSGITISPGGLAQAYQRVAGRLEGDYEALKGRLLASQSVHTDETSWWVGGPKASLWVFCNRQGTYYRVVESKNRATFYEVIPPEWKGVLVSDCLRVYDNATEHQHKCYAHHLKAIKQALEQGGLDEAGSYPDRCGQLLHTAMELRSGWEQRAPPQREEKLRILKAGGASAAGHAENRQAAGRGGAHEVAPANRPPVCIFGKARGGGDKQPGRKAVEARGDSQEDIVWTTHMERSASLAGACLAGGQCPADRTKIHRSRRLPLLLLCTLNGY
jgi:hypothetical protein